MIGILLITHGTLGESLIHCASHVLNKRPPLLKQLSITAQDDPFHLLPQARALVKDLDEGDGVLIMSDMYGGSPSNIAARLLIPHMLRHSGRGHRAEIPERYRGFLAELDRLIHAIDELRVP